MSNLSTGKELRKADSFATVTVDMGVPELKPNLLRVYCCIVRHSFIKNGERQTHVTNAELADHIGSSTDKIRRALKALEERNLLWIEQTDRGRKLFILGKPTPERFVILPGDGSFWKLTDRAFKVYFGLRRFRGDKPTAFMKNRTLAAFLGMTERNIKAGYQEIVKAGLVFSSLRWVGHGWSRTVLFDDSEQMTPQQKVSSPQAESDLTPSKKCPHPPAKSVLRREVLSEIEKKDLSQLVSKSADQQENHFSISLSEQKTKAKAPGVNGSGQDAREVIARQNGLKPESELREFVDELKRLPGAVKTDVQRKARELKAIGLIDGIWWYHQETIRAIVTGSESEPEVIRVVEQDKQQELKEISLKRNGVEAEAMAMWKAYETKATKEIAAKLGPVTMVELKKENEVLQASKETIIKGYVKELNDKLDANAREIEKRYAPKLEATNKNRAETGLDSILTVTLV